MTVEQIQAPLAIPLPADATAQQVKDAIEQFVWTNPYAANSLLVRELLGETHAAKLSKKAIADKVKAIKRKVTRGKNPLTAHSESESIVFSSEVNKLQWLAEKNFSPSEFATYLQHMIALTFESDANYIGSANQILNSFGSILSTVRDMPTPLIQLWILWVKTCYNMFLYPKLNHIMKGSFRMVTQSNHFEVPQYTRMEKLG